MEPADHTLAAAIVTEATNCLNSCMVKNRHCLGQLTDQQVWWRPHPSMNCDWESDPSPLGQRAAVDRGRDRWGPGHS